MQSSVVNYSAVTSLFDFRIDGEYWHPEFIANSLLVTSEKRISDFISSDIRNIKSSPVSEDFEYLEISGISSFNYRTTKIRQGEAPDRAHYILERKDIAVSTVRPNRNTVAFIRHDGLVGSSGLLILRARDIEAGYLYVFCKTYYFVNCLVRATKATMYPAVSNSDAVDTPIFIPSPDFRGKIQKIVVKAFALSDYSEEIYSQAQDAFLTELGLTQWQPKHQLTFIKNYSDVKKSGRIDAEYFQPKYEEIIKAIKNYSGGWDTLGNLVSVKKCVEVGSGEYLDKGVPFIRVSNLGPFEITEEKYISENLYTKIKQHQPQKGEILFSKDATPGIAYHLKGEPQKMISSSGIVRLKNKTNKVNNEYLTLILNSILTKEQVNRDVGGSVILHWQPNQIKETVIPILPDTVQTQIQQKVTESFALRKQSKHLLECAKRAVEIAIEKNEKTAIDWLKSKTDESLFGAS